MNPNYYQNQINNLEREIADLHKKIADENRKELNKQKQIDTVNRSITRNTSVSNVQSKNRQIQGYQNEIANSKKKIADYQKKISTKSADLGKKKAELRKAEDQELKRSQKQQLEFQRKLEKDIRQQKEQLDFLVNQSYTNPNQPDSMQGVHKEFDFFISHASEDKDDIVRGLANALKEAGFAVWYDEFELTIGDSLRKKIDAGLALSKFGIVIISPYFVKKNWPEYELNGMVAREMNGHKVILPIWHKITKDEVLEFSPTLADKLALNTSIHSMADIVSQLTDLIKKTN